MKILSLDLATKTGWATNVNGNRSGVMEFPLQRGESPGMRFLRFRGWLSTMKDLLGGVGLISFEQAHHRGGAATSLCVGLVTEVLAFASGNGIETLPVHTATLKKYATGSGRAGKEDMYKAAVARGYLPVDDNEADAILLLEYTLETLGIGKAC